MAMDGKESEYIEQSWEDLRGIVAAAISNWAMWRVSGFVGPTGGRSPMAWLDQLITRKAPVAGVPVLNGAAMDTHEVLGRMQPHLRDVLCWYYLGHGKTVQQRFETFNAEREEQERNNLRIFVLSVERTRISMRTFLRQVSQAHVEFEQIRRDYIGTVRSVGRANAMAAAAARPPEPAPWPALPVSNNRKDPVD